MDKPRKLLLTPLIFVYPFMPSVKALKLCVFYCIVLLLLTLDCEEVQQCGLPL